MKKKPDRQINTTIPNQHINNISISNLINIFKCTRCNKYNNIIQERNIEVEVLTNKEISEKIDIQESVHQGVAIQVKKLELTSIERLLKTVNENSVILFYSGAAI